MRQAGGSAAACPNTQHLAPTLEHPAVATALVDPQCKMGLEVAASMAELLAVLCKGARSQLSRPCTSPASVPKAWPTQLPPARPAPRTPCKQIKPFLERHRLWPQHQLSTDCSASGTAHGPGPAALGCHRVTGGPAPSCHWVQPSLHDQDARQGTPEITAHRQGHSRGWVRGVPPAVCCLPPAPFAKGARSQLRAAALPPAGFWDRYCSGDGAALPPAPLGTTRRQPVGPRAHSHHSPACHCCQRLAAAWP